MLLRLVDEEDTFHGIPKLDGNSVFTVTRDE